MADLELNPSVWVMRAHLLVRSTGLNVRSAQGRRGVVCMQLAAHTCPTLAALLAAAATTSPHKPREPVSSLWKHTGPTSAALLAAAVTAVSAHLKAQVGKKNH